MLGNEALSLIVLAKTAPTLDLFILKNIFVVSCKLLRMSAWAVSVGQRVVLGNSLLRHAPTRVPTTRGGRG